MKRAAVGEPIKIVAQEKETCWHITWYEEPYWMSTGENTCLFGFTWTCIHLSRNLIVTPYWKTTHIQVAATWHLLDREKHLLAEASPLEQSSKAFHRRWRFDCCLIHPFDSRIFCLDGCRGPLGYWQSKEASDCMTRVAMQMANVKSQCNPLHQASKSLQSCRVSYVGTIV